jgi:hypothetical protein
MRRLLYTLTCAIVLTTTVGIQGAVAQDDSVPDTLLTPLGWIEFSDNLVEAIAEGNEGAKEGALMQIIRYGDFLTFDRRTTFDVMRLYRDHDDDRIRRLAVVALGKMKDRWAIEFLDMLARFEPNEQIKNTMKSTVEEYWKKNPGHRPPGR